MQTRGQARFVDFAEIPELCAEEIESLDARRRMGPLAAYFWCNLVALPIADVTSLLLPGWSAPERVPLSTPQTYVFFSTRDPGCATVTIRGTRVLKDVYIDAKVGRPSRLSSTYSLTSSYSTHDQAVTELLRGDIEELQSSDARVHRGIFSAAAKILRRTLPILLLRSEQLKSIVIYGHSLGGACASLVYAWLRRLFAADAVDIKCVVLSCPSFLDKKGRVLLFQQRGLATEDAYRHYYTRGDPIVHKLPGAVGLTSHASTLHRVAPPAAAKKLPGSVLLRHVVYRPAFFTAVTVRDDEDDALVAKSQSLSRTVKSRAERYMLCGIVAKDLVLCSDRFHGLVLAD